MALYRKYRPQRLEELDNTKVRSSLTQLLSSSFFSHAYLFTGPKGTGKTSAARIVAKILNCEQKTENLSAQAGKKQKTKNKEQKNSKLAADNKQPSVDIEPCNVCGTCISITEGRHLDILEIDAASNRGIEEIRDLREKIKLAPISAKFKVFIIDEVHMLTNEAFNALLKTLEEPPLHAVFILATTEAEKLPSTIISRCLRIHFHKAGKEEVKRSLKRVVEGEKIDIHEQILDLISEYSDGSFRDATKILQQAISEDALTVDKLLKLLGRGTLSSEKFLQIIFQKDTGKALSFTSELAKAGADFRYFVSDLLNALHALLLSSFNISENPEIIVLEEKPTVAEISSLIKLFSKVYVDLKSAFRPELPLEIAIIEWCEGKSANK